MLRRGASLSLISLLVACGGASSGSPRRAGSSSGDNAGGGGGNAGGSGGNTGGSSGTSSFAGTGGAPENAASSGTGTGSGGGTTTGACTGGLPGYPNGNGSVTYYNLGSASAAVNCGFPVLGANPDVLAHVATGDGHYFGAMNTADYEDAAACGACVELTRDGTRKVVVTIVDQCPSASNTPCKAGHIDLSEEAFAQLGATSEGYLGTGNGGAVGLISWRYVACPVNGGVTFQLKDPTNAYWNQILVEGHRYPIAKVEVKVNGQWVSAVRQSYNYWQAGDGDLGSPPYEVRATDIHGDPIEATLSLTGAEQSVSSQFPACQ